jgi:hypothetical protein
MLTHSKMNLEETHLDLIAVARRVKELRKSPAELENALSRYSHLSLADRKAITSEVMNLAQDEVFCGWAGIDYHNYQPQDSKSIQAALARRYTPN